jgi:hypothetical protein
MTEISVECDARITSFPGPGLTVARPAAGTGPRSFAGIAGPGTARAPSQGDPRFRDLVGPAAWSRLPEAVRQRFSRHVEPGGMRLFRGHVSETRLSPAGHLLARLAMLVGGPLPVADGATGPAAVLVTESPGLDGQIWTRTYTRPGRFPQTINSVKRFMGLTGLEEHLGAGLVMRLTLGVEAGCLVFRSAGYDLLVAGRRWSIPRWLAPGTCTITHRDEGRGRFSFTLDLTHGRFGTLAHQVAHFEEVFA